MTLLQERGSDAENISSPLLIMPLSCEERQENTYSISAHCSLSLFYRYFYASPMHAHPSTWLSYILYIFYLLFSSRQEFHLGTLHFSVEELWENESETGGAHEGGSERAKERKRGERREQSMSDGSSRRQHQHQVRSNLWCVSLSLCFDWTP